MTVTAMSSESRQLFFRGELPIDDIRDICPRCLGHEWLHPRHPWDCDIEPAEWREFYAAPWPAIYMVRFYQNRRWPEQWP